MLGFEIAESTVQVMVITGSSDRDHGRRRADRRFDVALEIVFWSRFVGLEVSVLRSFERVRRSRSLRSILWFDPRREHSSIPTTSLAAVARRACQGWPRLRGHLKGLPLTGPSTAAC